MVAVEKAKDRQVSAGMGWGVETMCNQEFQNDCGKQSTMLGKTNVEKPTLRAPNAIFNVGGGTCDPVSSSGLFLVCCRIQHLQSLCLYFVTELSCLTPAPLGQDPTPREAVHRQYVGSFRMTSSLG